MRVEALKPAQFQSREPLLEEFKDHPDLEVVGEPVAMDFDGAGQLI